MGQGDDFCDSGRAVVFFDRGWNRRLLAVVLGIAGRGGARSGIALCEEIWQEIRLLAQVRRGGEAPGSLIAFDGCFSGYAGVAS